MTEKELLDELTDILRGLLGDDTIVLSAATKRPDVPGWDSFNYVNFIVAIEMRFGIKFGVAEVESFQSVGEIAQRTLTLTTARRK
jgi:acyl carrier protein